MFMQTFCVFFSETAVKCQEEKSEEKTEQIYQIQIYTRFTEKRN